jgi:hypothetical protein
MAGIRTNTVAASTTAAALLIVIVAYLFGPFEHRRNLGLSAGPVEANAQGGPAAPTSRVPGEPRGRDSVNLSDSQLAAVKPRSRRRPAV